MRVLLLKTFLMQLSAGNILGWSGPYSFSFSRVMGPLTLFQEQMNDYIAQGGSGFAVLKRNTTKFNTGGMEHTLLVGLELGADDYITKPFDIEELKLRVQGAIRRSERESLTDPRSGLPAGRLIEEQLKQLLPSVQIIMVTVYEDTERISAALGAGACGYLLKDCTAEELVAAVREAHSGGVPMPREIARKVIGTFKETSEAKAGVEGLRPSEARTLALLAQGLSNKEIANRLGVSVSTVRFHVENIYTKLQVHSRTEAALKFHSAKVR